jgi:pimeloyl-ACP methyl ester carboxylesterase
MRRARWSAHCCRAPAMKPTRSARPLFPGPPCRVTAAAILAVTGLLGCSTTVTDGDEDTGQDENNEQSSESGFEEADCADFAPLAAILEASDLTPDAVAPARCGTITVPESRVGRTDATIRLPVVVAQATAADAAYKRPAPLVILNGGPGFTSLGFVVNMVAEGPWRALREQRDVVLVNERGLQGSDPYPRCAELDGLGAGVFGDDGQVHPVDPAVRREALAACYTRLTEEGIDLASYNTFEMTADVHETLTALDYSSYHVMGISFGTLFAQHMALRFPEAVDSLVLDSPVASAGNVMLDLPRAVDGALGELFSACASDEACASLYPDLEQTFYAVVAAAEENPVPFDVPHPETGEPYRHVVTGRDIFGLVASNMKLGVAHTLPQLIAGMAQGSFETAQGLLAQQVVPGPDTNSAMATSVECSGWAYRSLDDRPAGVPEEVEAFLLPVMLEKHDNCAVWPVPQVEEVFADVFEPVRSDTLPALILPARFDGNTPTENGEDIAASLPRAFVHRFPDRGHVVAMDACANQVIADFLSDPSTDPDATCIDELTIPWSGAPESAEP